MTNIVSQPTATIATAQPARPGLLQEIRTFWRDFIVAAFNPYRPELHYMRGPGPAWHARHRRRPPSH